MLSIRLARKGKAKDPFYRVIIVDKRKDSFGTILENLGTYNPKTKETILKQERIEYWMSKGAQPSDTLHNLFITKGILKGKKVSVTNISKRRLVKLEAKQKKKDAEKPVEKPAEAKEADKPAAAPEPEKPAEKPAETTA